ncbi:MAG: glycosyltransferase family 2 protein [Chitinophagaceae bacterium]
MNEPFISIVSPVYKAGKTVSILVDQVKEEVGKITQDFEVILVEDGSPDNSWQAILAETAKDKRVKGIKLSRNFGQHYAITAGLDFTKGEWVVVMDCDLQDKPKEIINLYNEAQKGYDIVLARRTERKDAFHKKTFSIAFYKILSYLTGTDQDAAVANFGIYNRKVIDTICSMREQIRYFPTMVRWVGYKKSHISVDHGEREEGKTTYTFRRLLVLALDILLANSEKPIRLIVRTGFFISTAAFFFGLIVLIKYFVGSIKVLGYTSLIVSLWFLGGMIMMMLGIIGLYIGKTFQGVKNRPIYIISEKENLNES